MAQCKHVVLIDNKDSFVYNLARYVEELGVQTLVLRHDAVSIEQLKQLQPSHLIISPGPCGPKQAGISMQAIQSFYQSIPILGVCLGHQAIGEVFGATVEHAPHVSHGKSTRIEHHGEDVFEGVMNPFEAARYHSLHVSSKNFPKCLQITAKNLEGIVMGIRHQSYPTFGLQFHPESILTPQGQALLSNFLAMGL